MAQHGFCDLSFESPRSSHLSKAEPENIWVIFVTLSTRHSFSGWSNDEADQNMPSDERKRNDATITQVQGGILAAFAAVLVAVTAGTVDTSAIQSSRVRPDIADETCASMQG